MITESFVYNVTICYQIWSIDEDLYAPSDGEDNDAEDEDLE
jgi:hypothetical protein